MLALIFLSVTRSMNSILLKLVILPSSIYEVKNFSHYKTRTSLPLSLCLSLSLYIYIYIYMPLQNNLFKFTLP